MVQESGLFKRDDPVPGLGASPAIAQGAFALAEGAVSALLSPRGPVFVTVTGKKDPYTPMLDEVKDRVREDLIRTRAIEMSKQRAGEIAAALKGALNFAAAAKAQGFDAKDSTLAARGSAWPDVGASADLDRAAFALPVGGVSGAISTPDGAVILRVAERDEVTPDELAKGREAFRAQLLEERRSRFFAAYMTKAKGRLNVAIKPDVLQRVVSSYQLSALLAHLSTGCPQVPVGGRASPAGEHSRRHDESDAASREPTRQTRLAASISSRRRVYGEPAGETPSVATLSAFASLPARLAYSRLRLSRRGCRR